MRPRERSWLGPAARVGPTAKFSADELSKLEELHRSDVLTDVELAAQQANILV